MDSEMLNILRCPVDHSTLTLAEDSLIAKVNRAIEAGKVASVGGTTIEKPIDSGLIREAGDLLYPVVDSIPVMLHDEAIDLSQLGEEN